MSPGFTQLHATLFLGQGGCETPGVPWGSRGVRTLAHLRPATSAGEAERGSWLSVLAGFARVLRCTKYELPSLGVVPGCGQCL